MGNGCHQGGRDRPGAELGPAGPAQGDAPATRHLVHDGVGPWGSPHQTPAFSSVQSHYVCPESQFWEQLFAAAGTPLSPSSFLQKP